MLAAAPPESATALTRGDAPFEWSRAMVAARLGDRARALAISQRLAGARPTLEFRRVSILAALGEREEVRRRLRELLPAGSYFGDWWLHTEPVLQPYLREPEFRRLVRADG